MINDRFPAPITFVFPLPLLFFRFLQWKVVHEIDTGYKQNKYGDDAEDPYPFYTSANGDAISKFEYNHNLLRGYINSSVFLSAIRMGGNNIFLISH